MTVQLSTLSIGLGAVVLLVNLYGLLQPAKFADVARKFPRNLGAGYFFMLLGTAWFIWNVHAESLADFEPLKPYLYALFAAVGIGSCYFVQDFLAVRGLAVAMLLLGKLMVDAQRWAPSPWRIVIACWAYLLVVGGIWLTVSPWRLRDLVNWANANDGRVRLGSAIRCAWGLFVLVLGVTVFKGS
jgi:hypothetical protein